MADTNDRHRPATIRDCGERRSCRHNDRGSFTAFDRQGTRYGVSAKESIERGFRGEGRELDGVAVEIRHNKKFGVDELKLFVRPGFMSGQKDDESCLDNRKTN